MARDEPGPIQPPYEFSDQTLFTSHRGLLVFIRRLLNPVLKLFFNSNKLNQVLHAQAQFNVDMLQRDRERRSERNDWHFLYYEVLHNLVVETTRNGIELKNMRMRLEALSSRLEFSERRVRALEGVVQYRPEVVRSRDRDRDRHRERQAGHSSEGGETTAGGASVADAVPAVSEQSGTNTPADPGNRRRRRRRRGRRGPGLAPVGVPADSGTEASAEVPSADSAVEEDGFDSEDEVESSGEPDVIQSESTHEPAADHPDTVEPNDPDRQ
ncbi:MAG TPA: hypothetical protein VF424_03925 [Vicinamibacterales bacterium]